MSKLQVDAVRPRRLQPRRRKLVGRGLAEQSREVLPQHPPSAARSPRAFRSRPSPVRADRVAFEFREAAKHGQHEPPVLLGSLLFGLGLGNVTSLPPLIAQAEFAPADVQQVEALVTAFSQASYAFAPVAFGAFRNIGQTVGMSAHAGNALLLFYAAAVIQFAAAGAVMIGRRPIVACLNYAQRRTPPSTKGYRVV